MADTSFTPGPWEVTERHEYYEILGRRDNSDWYGRKGLWAVAYADTDRDEAEQLANAHLIRAAPDLLKSVQFLLECTIATAEPGDDPEQWEVVQHMRAAIARATPTQQAKGEA